MNKKYKAFISYSREDEKYAKKLHTKLETYVIPQELYKKYPNIPKKLSPIFRDIEQLRAGDKLANKILEKLQNSENLIVICSPRSAMSEWVNKEIIDFKRMHGEDRIFPIIIDGTPNSDDENECFPEAIKYKINKKGELTNQKSDILASNIIKSAYGKRFAEIKLIAGLLGVDNDNLWNFEEKRRKKKILIWSIIWGLVSLIIIGFAVFSWVQRNLAIENEQKTKKELYKNLMQKGILYRDFLNKPLYAKFIFAKAIQASTNKEEEENSKIVYNSVQNVKLLNLIKYKKAITNAKLSLDKKKLLISFSDIFFENTNFFSILDLNIYKESFFYCKDKIQNVIFVGNNKVISWGKKKIILWDIKSKKQLYTITDDSQIRGLVLSKDSSKIIYWNKNNKIILWDINNKRKLSEGYHNVNGEKIEEVLFSKNESNIITWSDKSLILWDNKLNFLKKMDINNSEYIDDIRGVVFNKDNTKIISWGYQGIRIWDTKTGKKLFFLKHSSCHGIDFNKNNQNIILSYGYGGTKFWNIKTGKELYNIRNKDDYSKSKFIDNFKVLNWYSDKIDLWNTFFNKQKFHIIYDNEISDIFLSKDKKYLIVSGGDYQEEGSTVFYDFFNGRKKLNLKSSFHVFGGIELDNIFLNWAGNTECYGNRTLFNTNSNNGELRVWKKNSNLSQQSFSAIETSLLFLNKGDILLEKQLPIYIKNFILNSDKTKIISWENNKLNVINIKKNIIEFNLKLKKNIYGAVLTKDNKKLFVNDEKHIYIYEFFSQKLIKTISYKYPLQGNLELTKKGNIVIHSLTGLELRNQNGKLLYKSKKSIRGKFFRNDNFLISILNKDISFSKIKPYSHYSLYLIGKHFGKIKDIKMNKEENLCVSWDNDNIILWNIVNFKQKLLLKHKEVRKVIFNSNSTKLLSMSNSKIKLWDIKTGQNLLTLDYHERILDIAINENFISSRSYKEEDILSDTHLNKYYFYKNKKLSKNLYFLKLEVESGCTLRKTGKLRVLNKTEWLHKKKIYEQILKESNP